MLKNPRILQFSRQALTQSSIWRSHSQRSILPKLSNFHPATFQRNFISDISRRFPARSQLTQTWRTKTLRSNRQVRLKSQQAGPGSSSAQEVGSQKPQSLSDRMKAMSRKYGWTVVGIYFGLSVLDFPFCFLAVRLFGVERIGQAEKAIVDGFWDLVEKVAPNLRPVKKEAIEETGPYTEAAQEVAGDSGHVAAHENASIWTQLILAYGVHKSLIFIRIPVTLAITPRIVKVLRSWGWNIGAKAA